MIPLSSPFVMAPMAGMTDTAFRRLVKRQGGCGLVVTEMVSSEGLVRGIDRTLEYAEFTEEERPVSVQIFGGDPEKMARAAQVVEKIGADVVDVNMGCPVPKVAKHNAGCSLMREPEHAAKIIRAMARAVSIPVTVKMRAGWSDRELNAPDLARRVEDAGAAAIAVHGRTAAQSYSGNSDWELIARVAQAVSIPVFGNGDCVEAADLLERQRASGVAGVLVGRGVLRNPWIFAQAVALANGRALPPVTLADRGRFLLDYIDLLLNERVNEPAGFRHVATTIGQASSLSDERGADLQDPRGAGLRAGEFAAPRGASFSAGAPAPRGASLRACALGPRGGVAEGRGLSLATGPAVPHAGSVLVAQASSLRPARGRERWVVNKVRALCAWYTRGLDGGSHLRVVINQTNSIPALRQTISEFFA
jgi:tRNA-dihydrouridine synthase B